MNHDILAAIVLIIFAAAMTFQSIQLGLGTLNDPGPGFLPIFSTLCIAVLSATYLVSQIVNRKSKKNLFFKLGPSWPKSLYLILLSFIYVAFLWDRLGYILGTTLWLVAIFKIGGIQSWKKIFITSVITVTVSYLLLEKVAKCVLPKGLLSFWGL